MRATMLLRRLLRGRRVRAVKGGDRLHRAVLV